MNSTVKATRTVIQLGNKEIEGFQLPCGKYKLSQSSTTLAVGKPPKRMVELTRSEAGQSLLTLGFEKGLKVAVENSKPVTLVTLEVAFQFWVLELSIGNLDALALVSACGIESIERRLDTAFGVIRSEQERNERFKIRQLSILSRHFWTDCIDLYCRTNDVSEDYKKWIYIHVSDTLNRRLFSKTSKEIREFYDIGENSPRDYFPAETLRQVEALEKSVATRVKNTNSEPLQALKDLIGFMGFDGNLPL